MQEMSSKGLHEKYKIDEELVSVDAFKHDLCSISNNLEVCIIRKHDDPPDFIVTIDGIDYPAEVTSIVTCQQYHAHCKEFAAAIEQKAISLGILSSKYAFIVFRSPKIPNPKLEEGKNLLEAAISFIQDTENNNTYSEHNLQDEESGKIGIARFVSTGSSVELIWTPPAMWEGEIINQLSNLIQQAVDKKKKKLQKKGIEKHRSILLLYDAFGYAKTEHAVAAMKHVNDYDWFHSIFWAASFANRENVTFPEEPGRKGHFLFSHNSQWNCIGTI